MSRLLSVVVPCFNEQEVIEETYEQLASTLEALCARRGLRYEILFVDDGSRDATLARLHDLHGRHREKSREGSTRGDVGIVALARNFGHQVALSAGLAQARGEATVAIDADLQDPPAVIDRMVEKWMEGVDVVFGVRGERQGETIFKVWTAKAFYHLVRRITRVDIPLDTGDFRLMSRRALDVFNKMPERHRFVRGMVPWIGFRQEPIRYDRAARFAGTTKYPFHRMFRLALDGITSFSDAPLRTAYLLGMFVAGLCIVYAGLIIVHKLVTGYPVQGWSSLMVAILFLGSVQLITIGILGEYIGRIYDEVKHRPLFIVDHDASRLP